MTVILTSGVTATNSDEFTVVAGTPATLAITAADGTDPHPDTPAFPVKKESNAGGVYKTIGWLNKDNLWSAKLDAPGVYVVGRPALATAVVIEQT